MNKLSAGILPYRKRTNNLEVFLVHPGGPYNANKDLGYWSIPKGEPDDNEDLIDTAIREVSEEIGLRIENKDDLKYVGSIKQKSGKVVHCWLFEFKNGYDIKVNSNMVLIEWPPKSNKFIQIPEVDRGEWFNLETAKRKINPAQVKFVEEVEKVNS